MMKAEEIELHIRDCSMLMNQEMAAGNREAALNWLQAIRISTQLREVIDENSESGYLGFSQDRKDNHANRGAE